MEGRQPGSASENPAAIAWPPPVSSIPACRAAITAAPRSMPVTDRPLPLAMPSASAATQAGRLNRSLIRPAMMPTTPGCQSTPDTSTAARPFGDLRPGRLQRRIQHRCLDRLALAVHRVQRGGHVARLHRVVAQQQPQTEPASPMRPPALMRGPSA